jgi:uncharacterized protein YndB with AHSA1/START domain
VAHYRAVVDTTRKPDDVFAYLADFHHVAEWDPGVARARALDGEPRLGARYEVVTLFRGREMPLTYEVTAFQPPHQFVVRGSNGRVESLDTITVESTPTGSRVTYNALLNPLGIWVLLGPLFARAFQKIGGAAHQGLRRALTT